MYEQSCLVCVLGHISFTQCLSCVSHSYHLTQELSHVLFWKLANKETNLSSWHRSFLTPDSCVCSSLVSPLVLSFFAFCMVTKSHNVHLLQAICLLLSQTSAKDAPPTLQAADLSVCNAGMEDKAWACKRAQPAPASLRHYEESHLACSHLLQQVRSPDSYHEGAQVHVSGGLLLCHCQRH